MRPASADNYSHEHADGPTSPGPRLSTYENLYEEDYILYPGSASVAGGFPLNDHEDRHPWHDATPEAATGYIVDGDLTVDGNILDWDDGASALVVLGNLRAASI